VIARVNGIDLFYEIDGTGPMCFVLHGGLGIDHTLYRRSLQPLTARLRLVFVDHRGNGQSDRVPLETLSMEQFADDVIGLAEALQLDDFMLLGHSYGGYIAQETALRHSDRVNGLILVGTSPGRINDENEANRYPLPARPDEFIRLSNAPKRNADEAETFWRQATPFFTNADTVESLRTLMDGTVYEGPIYETGTQQISPRWNATDRLHALQMPVLVLVGSNDIINPPAQSRRMTDRLADATLVEIAGSNHFPWIETPEAFYDSVSDWLDANHLL
jgi:proline iminopeptidase